jgi:hypothetical protein
MTKPVANSANASTTSTSLFEPVAGKFGAAVVGKFGAAVVGKFGAAVVGTTAGANPITLTGVELLTSVPFPNPP